VQVWLDVAAISSSAYPGFGSGGTNIAKHWFLLFIFSKKPSSGSGQTEFYFPTCTKPCSLCAIRSDTLKIIHPEKNIIFTAEIINRQNAKILF
jgi:hypothetical protein